MAGVALNRKLDRISGSSAERERRELAALTDEELMKRIAAEMEPDEPELLTALRFPLSPQKSSSLRVGSLNAEVKP